MNGSASAQGSQSSGGLFSSLGSAINTLADTGKTAFGSVANIASTAATAINGVASTVLGGVNNAVKSSGLVEPISKSTTLLAGVLGNTASTAFTNISNTVNNVANKIGGALGANSNVVGSIQ